MATLHTTSVTLPAQARTARATSTWPPQSGLMHTRPWRSSPLARPAFSTLPPIISESSEESHENDSLDPPHSSREFGHTHHSPSSSSIVSDSPAASTSGYASRNASGSASALMLVDGAASTSSVSLHASSSTHGTGTSSHDLGNSQSKSHSHRPARLTKSPGRRPSSAQERLQNVSETSITPPPRARTVSHGHSRSASFPSQTVAPSPTIPQVYSRASPRPTSHEPESNASKQQPSSTSRDPTSNWMSSSPFGPAMTPKFSRLAMASPAVVMPLSAREYRKRKARESLGKGKETEPQTASNHVTFTDNPPSMYQIPNGVPLVKVSPPPSDSDVHQPRSPPLSSGDHTLDRRTKPQPQADHPPPKPLPHASLSAQPQSQPTSSSPKHKRPRSRPNTPPRSSPLASHPPISPKSSAGTFFSFASASSSDDDMTPLPPSHPLGTDDPNATNAIPPARPRPRPRRRKSYPDRLSNGARLSLLEAMNRLSQESVSLSQTDGVNRLSLASQASGHTLFYDAESDEEGPAVNGDDRDGDGDGGQQRMSVLHTQSLEDLSSTLARTGIEVVHPDNDGDPGVPLDDERKGRRNVRMVRISDTVEVSPPPVPRRRKLTKSRPGLVRGSVPGPAPGTGTGLGTVKETKVQTQTQTQERRGSLLPWKSEGSSSDGKGGAVGVRSGMSSAGAGEKRGKDHHPPSTPTKGLVHPNETTAPAPVPHTPAPIANGSVHFESPTKLKSSSPTKKPSSDSPTSTSTPSTTPRKTHRYTFSFLSSPTFHRHKREKSSSLPANSDQLASTKGKPKESSVKGVESGTDSTSTSIRTITSGSQSTLTPASPLHYDLTTPASSGRGTGSSTVPMLRRLNAQEMATVGVPAQSEWDGGGDSTPSLITNGSTATSSSGPRTFTHPSFVRLPGGEPFVPQPSGLKECFSDTSEDDMDGVRGGEEKERTPRVCMHRRQDQRPSARAGGAETSEEDERVCLHARSSSGLSVSIGLSPSPRPGTPSSTLTTATETSGSYASFSTIPASTTSSSSTSPSLMMGDKRDRVGSVPLGKGGGGDGDDCTCALCGQLVPLSISPSSSPTRDLDQAEMHPMFTVPLVTIPAGTYPRGRDAGMGMGSDARYGGRRKTGSERHLSVPVPARSGQFHDDMHAHVIAKGVRVPAPVGAGAGTLTTKARSEKRTTMSPSPLPSPPKVKKPRRPQTAPAGTGDATSKFIEDARALRARDGSVDGHVSLGVGGDRATKHHRGGSKFKTVLKGLLRWHG